MNEQQNEKWIVRCTLVKGGLRYGQNRSKTFDYSNFAVKIEDAKTFDSCEEATRWAWRVLSGYMNGPQPFIDLWHAVPLSKAIDQERIGTWNIPGQTLKTGTRQEVFGF